MSLSFSVVLGVMIALFRPAPAPPATSSGSLPESSAQSSKALAGTASADTAGSTPDTAAVRSASHVAGEDTARERADLNLLRAEVEGHLRAQKTAEDQKIAHLARLCARMEPGQAAAALSSLDDATIHRVLLQLDKDLALKIQAVLVRIRKGSG